jgi:hypothetical protein
MDQKISLPEMQIADFCRRWNITELALFGSILRDDFDAASDIDVLINFSSEAKYSFRHVIAMQNELESILGRRIDLVDKQAVERSPNYIRRQAILSSYEVIYAA